MFFLDIETSGLDSESCFINCIGLQRDSGLAQFSSDPASFSNTVDDLVDGERQLLMRFCDACRYDVTDTLVTFNGAHFDLPFLARRLDEHGLDLPKVFLESKHVDLFDFANKLAKDSNPSGRGKWLSQGEAIMRFTNVYVPKCCSSSYIAQTYSAAALGHRVDLMDHVELLQHNAIDLFALHKLFIAFGRNRHFPAFVESCHAFGSVPGPGEM